MNSTNGYMTFDDFIECNNTAVHLSRDGKFDEAKPYVDKAIEICAFIISSNINTEGLTPKDYAKVFALGGYIYGELGDYDHSLSLYQHYQFLKTQLKHDFRDKTQITLYQFRSDKQHTITNLRKNQFTFANPRNQNDIVDSPIFTWIDHILEPSGKYDKHIPSLKESYNGYRIASFCMDSESKRAISNTLMWSHYADSHKGFCVEYILDKSDFKRDSKTNISASRLFKVDYLEPGAKLDLSDPDGTLSSKKAHFTKSSDWSYENEVRMISYDPLTNEEYPSFGLGKKSYISAIYFGFNCPQETIDKVKDALSGRNVSYYKMTLNPHNIYSLEPIPIL